MKTIISLFSILILTSISLAETLSLDDAISLALENNPQIQIAKNSEKIAQNDNNPGNAGLLPSLSVSVSESHTGTTASDGTDSELSINTAKINSSYSLFNGFRNLNTYKQLQKLSEQTSLESRSVIESTVYMIAQYYYNTANAWETLQYQTEALHVSRERLTRIREKDRFGQAGTVDLLSAQVDFNTDSINVVQAKQNWLDACRSLNLALNRKIDTPVEVVSTVNFLELPALDELKTKAFENNADYLSSEKDIDLAQLNLELSKATLFPSLNLTGSYGLSNQSLSYDYGFDNADRDLSVGLSLSFNLFNGFQNKINRQNAKINIENQKLTRQNTALSLEKEVYNSYENYNTSRNILDLNEQNLEVTELNFSRTRELYELGQVTSTQFREAQLNLLNIKSTIASARYTAKLNEIYLLKITGELL